MPNKIGDKQGTAQTAPVSLNSAPQVSTSNNSPENRKKSAFEKSSPPSGPSYNEALKAAFSDALDGSGDDETNARQGAGRIGSKRENNEGDVTDNSSVDKKSNERKNNNKKPNPNKTDDAKATTEKSQSVADVSLAPPSSLARHEKLVMSLGSNASSGEIRTLASAQSFGNLKSILSNELWETSPRKSKSLNDLQMSA